MSYLLTAGSEYSVLTVNYDSGNKMWQVQYHDLRARADPRFPTKLNKLSSVEGVSKKKKTLLSFNPLKKTNKLSMTLYSGTISQKYFILSLLDDEKQTDDLFLFPAGNSNKNSKSMHFGRDFAFPKCSGYQGTNACAILLLTSFFKLQMYILNLCKFGKFWYKEDNKKKIITLTINGKILIQTRRFIFKTAKLIQ